VARRLSKYAFRTPDVRSLDNLALSRGEGSRLAAAGTCTWPATEALHALRESGALSDWGRLIFLFPGW
jgi:hypothetical protein